MPSGRRSARIAYANERKQGRAAGTKAGQMSPIIEHPDIRRKLLTMQALTQAARGDLPRHGARLDVSHTRQGRGSARQGAPIAPRC